MILTETATATTIDTAAPATFTCAQCPFARHIDGNRYCCQVSQTASDVKRGHWEATISCFEALAQAKAEAEKAAEVEEAPIAQTVAPAPATPKPATPKPATPKPATPSTPAPATLSAEKTATDSTPEAIETDNQPPGRGDGRGRVQPIAKTDKKLAAIFNDRPKQYQQFLIIREELTAIGVKVGKLINSREDAKGWRLDWDGDKAGLYWTVGNGWEVASLKYETELAGNWEGFDLSEHLDCNGIDLEDIAS